MPVRNSLLRIGSGGGLHGRARDGEGPHADSAAQAGEGYRRREGRSPHTRDRRSADGMSREDAARSAGMDRQTLRDWVLRYNAHGVDGLAGRWNGGRPPTVSSQEQAEIVRVLLAGPKDEASGPPVPRERLVEARSRMLGDAGEHDGEPGLRGGVVHLGRDDQAMHGGCARCPLRSEPAKSLAFRRRAQSRGHSARFGHDVVGQYRWHPLDGRRAR